MLWVIDEYKLERSDKTFTCEVVVDVFVDSEGYVDVDILECNWEAADIKEWLGQGDIDHVQDLATHWYQTEGRKITASFENYEYN